MKLGSPIAAETAAQARDAWSTMSYRRNGSTRQMIEYIQRSGVTTLTGVAKAGGILSKRITLNPDGSVKADGSACTMASEQPRP